MIPFWLFIIFVICALIYLYGNLNKTYWQDRSVPSTAESTWLLGSYKDIILAKKHIGLVFQDIYNEHPDARYIGYLKIRKPSILLRDPALIKAVLCTDFASFSNNDIEVDKNIDFLFGNNPFVLKGEEWKRSRSHLTPTTASTRLKTYFPTILSVCDAMAEYVESQINRNGLAHLETKLLAGMYTTDVVLSAVFGIENNTFRDPDNIFHITAKSIFESNYLDNLKVLAILFLPKLANILRIRFSKKNAEDVLVSMTKKVLKHRMETGETRNDFFQQMIQFKQNDKLGEFTDEYIAAHCFNFLGDGYESSSDVICFTLFELAWHQDIQDRLRQELNDKLEENDGKLSLEALAELKYLDMVVSESLRLHPPIFFKAKVCTKSYTLPPSTKDSREYKVPVGTPVLLSAYSLHRDPKHYPDPDKFDPERFTPVAVAARDKYVYLPFSEGPRQCTGMKFSHMQVKAALVTLVARFRVKPSPKSGYPIGVDPRVFLKRPLNGAWVHFETI